jgi:hypothetical protein
VLNVQEKALFLGPAERADVIVDFSQYAGKTLILYNDAPAPVPALDPRIDYYTGHVDFSMITGDGTGGGPPTLPGFGPNTRTIMQIRVANTAPAQPFSLPALQAAFASTGTTQGAFAASQEPIIVPQAAYNSAYFTNVVDLAGVNFARIQDNSMNFTPHGQTTPLTLDLQPKSVIEDFQTDYGRMNALLGVEIPRTSNINQTSIPQGYNDPPTEIVKLTDPTMTLIGEAADGTQLWKITHNGVDTHALHFHMFHVQIVNRVGWDGAISAPDPNELGWKDTIRANPLEDIIVAIRPRTLDIPSFKVPNSVRPLAPAFPLGSTVPFTNIDPTGLPVNITNVLSNFGWEYVWHCHLLGHEENDMMRALVVAAPPEAPSGLAAVLAGSNVSLFWTDNSLTATSFTLQRATDLAFTQNLETWPLGYVTTFSDTTNPLIGTTYYRVIAHNTVGSLVPGYPTVTADSVFSNTATMAGNQTVPGAPIIGAAVAGNTQATVTFSAPLSNGGSPILSYTVTSNPGGFTASGSAGPITVPGLKNGTPYTFTVTATNAVGTGPPSAPSNVVVPATVPGAPTIGIAVGGNAQATVSFTPPASDGGSAITYYTVTSSPGGQIAVGSASPITITGLNNGTAYTFTVTASNAMGTGPPSAPSNSVTPATVPNAPTGVSAVGGNAQATVSFSAPAFNGGNPITLYTVTSNPGGITATGTASPIAITGLTNGTAYTFTVTATNVVGTGPPSAPSNSVTPATAPGAPTGVGAVGGNAQATVYFTAPASNGGGPIIGYTVTSNPGGITATGTASPITITGLTNGTTYFFTVTATNTAGTSLPSGPSNSVTPVTVPGAPTGTTAVGGNTQATVSFAAPASNGGAAILLYTVTSSPGGITTTGTASPITVTGLTNGTAYTFTVAATNGAGTGPASSPSNSVTPLPPPPPAPANLRVTGTTRTSVSLSWTNTSNTAQGFYIWLRGPNGVWTQTATLNSGTRTSYTVSGLTRDTRYSFRVQAFNTGGHSPNSNGVNARTLP